MKWMNENKLHVILWQVYLFIEFVYKCPSGILDDSRIHPFSDRVFIKALLQTEAVFPTSGYVVTEGGASVTHRKLMKTDTSAPWSAVKPLPETTKTDNSKIDISISAAIFSYHSTATSKHGLVSKTNKC